MNNPYRNSCNKCQCYSCEQEEDSHRSKYRSVCFSTRNENGLFQLELEFHSFWKDLFNLPLTIKTYESLDKEIWYTKDTHERASLKLERSLQRIAYQMGGKFR